MFVGVVVFHDDSPQRLREKCKRLSTTPTWSVWRCDDESFGDHGIEVALNPVLHCCRPGEGHRHRSDSPTLTFSLSRPRLSLSVKMWNSKASVAEVAAAIEDANPGGSGRLGAVTVESLMKDVEVDPEDASHVLTSTPSDIDLDLILLASSHKFKGEPNRLLHGSVAAVCRSQHRHMAASEPIIHLK